MTEFYTLWTDTGLTRLGEAALETPFNITTAVLGDGNGVPVIPNKGQATLVNPVWTGPVSSKTRSHSDPDTIVFEIAIPAGDGPFTIREVGLQTSDGQLCITGNFPVTEKPVAADGSVRDLVLRIPVHFENADVVNLTVDPAVVLATKADMTAHELLQLDPAGTDGEKTKHLSDAQAKKWEDHVLTPHVARFGGQNLIDDPGMIGGSCIHHPGYEGDLNNILKAGRWDYDASDLNKPNEPFGVGVVDVFHDEIEGRLTQIVTSTVKPEMFMRNSIDSGSNWTDWVEFAEKKDIEDHAQTPHIKHFGGQSLVDDPGTTGGSCDIHPDYDGDLNNIVKAGFWDFERYDFNTPNSDTAGMVWVVHDASEGRLVQNIIGTYLDIPEMYTRSSSDGGVTWSEWVEFLNDKQLVEPVEYTVGASGDFATLSAALDFALRRYPRFKSSKAKVSIKILSGTIITEPVSFKNIDLSWITIDAEDPVVPVTVSGTFLNSQNASLPLMNVLWDMATSSGDIAGLSLSYNSYCRFNSGKGIINSPYINVTVNTGATLIAPGCKFSGASRNNNVDVYDSGRAKLSGADMSHAGASGLTVSHGGIVHAEASNCSNAAANGCTCAHAAFLTISHADCSNVGENGIFASNGGVVAAFNVNAGGAGIYGFEVFRGGTISAWDADGTTNISKNTLTTNGIIFKNN
ncbi:MAG: phage tail protein [Desulfobacter sp.]